MDTTSNRISMNPSTSAGSMTGIDTLSPVVMFEWIKAAIKNLDNKATKHVAQALERQSTSVLQIMMDAYASQVDDPIVLHLAHVEKICTNQQSGKSQQIESVLILHQVLELFDKVVKWKASRKQNPSHSTKAEPIPTSTKSEEERRYNLNPALLKNNKSRHGTLVSFFSRNFDDDDVKTAEAGEEDDEEEDESIIRIPSKKKKPMPISNTNSQFNPVQSAEQPIFISSQPKPTIAQPKQQDQAMQIKVKQEIIELEDETQSENHLEEPLGKKEVTNGRGGSASTSQVKTTAQQVQGVQVEEDENRYLRLSQQAEDLDIFSKDSIIDDDDFADIPVRSGKGHSQDAGKEAKDSMRERDQGRATPYPESNPKAAKKEADKKCMENEVKQEVMSEGEEENEEENGTNEDDDESGTGEEEEESELADGEAEKEDEELSNNEEEEEEEEVEDEEEQDIGNEEEEKEQVIKNGKAKIVEEVQEDSSEKSSSSGSSPPLPEDIQQQQQPKEKEQPQPSRKGATAAPIAAAVVVKSSREVPSFVTRKRSLAAPTTAAVAAVSTARPNKDSRALRSNSSSKNNNANVGQQSESISSSAKTALPLSTIQQGAASGVQRQLPQQPGKRNVSAANQLERIHANVNVNIPFDLDSRKRKSDDASPEKSGGFPPSKQTKQSPSDKAYSEFSLDHPPWHMNQPTKPRVFSDKIKKYRRIDYEKEQQEKQAEAKKARRVQFCLKNTRVQMFDIAEGNTLGRSTSQEGVINVYAPTSTVFLRGALGTPANPQPAGFRHRQLTAQIQKDITSLTEIVKQRTKAVVDQSNREGYGERIELLERVVRHTRLFVTDSLLANIDDSQFRNMLFFRLDNQKNMNMLLDGLQSQSQYIIKEVNAFEFSYIFLLYGFDLIEHGERAPSVDYVSKLHNFFKTLANLELRRDEKEREYDATYQYLVPQLVLITIPEIGNHIEHIKEFNQQIRNFVQAKKASHSHNFHLVDWAEAVAERKSAATEAEVDDNKAVRILVKELLVEYGVLCM